jgi:hypothetical protein
MTQWKHRPSKYPLKNELFALRLAFSFLLTAATLLPPLLSPLGYKGPIR